MKNFTILALSFVFVTVTKAQFTTGQTLVTGQVSFNESNNNQYVSTPNGYQKNASFYTSFGISKFKNPLLLSGFGLGYSYGNYHTNDGTAASDQLSRQNAFQLYYTRSKLKSLAKNLYLSFNGNAGFSYNHNNNKTNYGLSGNSGNSYGGELSGGLGMIYRIDKHFLTSVNFTNLLDLSYTGGYNDYFNPTQSFRKNYHQLHFGTGLTSFTLDYILFGISYLIK